MKNHSLPHLIASLSNRAQQIAHHNLDELNIASKSPTEQALFCFLIAIEENKGEELKP